MSYIITNASILDQSGELVRRDIRLNGGNVTEIGENLSTSNEQVFAANGKFVSAGFIDLHVHLREPGGEEKETISTGTHAAAKGGYTTVAAMPNTRPVPDSVEHLQALNAKIAETALIRVLPYAAITTRQLGKELTDMDALQALGAFAFTDDGVGVQEAGMMYKAMKKAASIGAPIVAHCEDNSLIYGGCMHEGEKSAALSLPGIPSICESVHIARDVLLAEAAQCHYHVCHVSTKESVRVIRDAKKAGIHVTAEVTPHHLLLTEDDIPGNDAQYKMNPPLRAKADRDALREGLLDGTIDFIATDHAPHSAEEKATGMKLAPFGIVGLETAFPLLYTSFVQTGEWTLKQLTDWMTINPVETFKLPFGKLQVGEVADITVINLEETAKIDPATFVSKGKNTPFTNWDIQGFPVATFLEGKLVWEKGDEGK